METKINIKTWFESEVRKSSEKDIYDEGFGVPHDSVDTAETWEL